MTTGVLQIMVYLSMVYSGIGVIASLMHQIVPLKGTPLPAGINVRETPTSNVVVFLAPIVMDG